MNNVDEKINNIKIAMNMERKPEDKANIVMFFIMQEWVYWLNHPTAPYECEIRESDYNRLKMMNSLLNDFQGIDIVNRFIIEHKKLLNQLLPRKVFLLGTLLFISKFELEKRLNELTKIHLEMFNRGIDV